MKLIKIYSKTCGPCKVLEKNLIESGINYINVDIESDEAEAYINNYGVRSVPTLLLISDTGVLVNKHTGLLTVEGIKEFIGDGKI